MHLVTSLVCFGIRQALGVDVENVAAAVEKHFTDHSQTFPRALATANDKAWKALGVALAGDSFLDQIKEFFASGEYKGLREQVTKFLESQSVSFADTPAEFRKACLAELKDARKKKLLSAENLGSKEEIAHQTADFRRFADSPGLAKGAEEAVARVADSMAPQYPNLARLLRQPTPGGPPLLVAAFCYFFRREVEQDEELAHGLFLDSLRQLAASQAQSFEEVSQALTTLGDRFDEVLEQLARIEQVVVQTYGAVLDLQAEFQRLSSLHLAGVDECRRLFHEVIGRLDKAGMRSGEVRPQHSLCIRGEEERRAVKQLLDRFRQLPEEQQKQVPALLNGLGKLQHGTGDFEDADRTFRQVAAEVSENAAKAEAFHNAFLAALEAEQWAKALEAIQQAAALDRSRFSPFPLKRYHPIRILGAGGFGTVFLCEDTFARNRQVAIKSLQAADLERGVEEVFAEAHSLMDLSRSHPSIIEVLDCSFADIEDRRRPYIVMQYFPGVSLARHVQERGTLTPVQLLDVARQVASSIKAAHDRDILHRDLKPDNTLVRDAGGRLEVKVIDFGLSLRREAIEAGKAAGSAAKTRLAATITGTVKYSPPEQTGDRLDVRIDRYSDVFSFGKLCCYALFRTTDPKDRHWRTSPEHERLKTLLERCTDEEPEHRCQNFDEVLAALDSLRSGVAGERNQADTCHPAPVRRPSSDPMRAPTPTPSRPTSLEIVQASCPHCHRDLKVPVNLLGKKVKCPKCQSVFAVNQPSAHPTASPLSAATGAAVKGAAPLPVPTSPGTEEDEQRRLEEVPEPEPRQEEKPIRQAKRSGSLFSRLFGGWSSQPTKPKPLPPTCGPEEALPSPLASLPAKDRAAVPHDGKYMTRLQDELQVYQSTFTAERLKGKHLTPHTLEMAATWAVLTRLEHPRRSDLTLLQKLRLYDGNLLPGFTEAEVRAMKRGAASEGTFGISPQYVLDCLADAVEANPQESCLNVFTVLHQIEVGLKYQPLGQEQLQHYRDLLMVVKEEYENIVQNEVQRAVADDEDALARLCSNYITNVIAYTQREKVRNRYTGNYEDPDERLMRSIETKIDIPEERKDDFRREFLNYVGALALDGKKFEYNTNERLQNALQLKLFEDQKDTLKLTSLVSNVIDKATQEKIEVVKSRLIRKYGYCEVCAMDVWTFVASIYPRGQPAKSAVSDVWAQWQKKRPQRLTVSSSNDIPVSGNDIYIPVPGRWHARVVTQTPASVTLRPHEVYGLEVDPSVTDKELTGLANLRGLPGLQVLDLWGCTRLTDAGLTHLHGLSALQTLKLAGCVQVRDAGLAHLTGLTALEKLDLKGCTRVTGTGLGHLRGLTALRQLSLRGCSQVTDAGLAQLGSLTGLQELDLSSCLLVTDAGLARLRRLTDLQELDLSSCSQVTDAGLAHLSSLTALQKLSLSGCSLVTDAGLAHLSRLTRLQKLYLGGCSRVTGGGLAHLKQALPDCDIKH